MNKWVVYGNQTGQPVKSLPHQMGRLGDGRTGKQIGMGTLLDEIDSPQDLKKLSEEELVQLAQEIRSLLIRFCRQYGGHLGSNLATVEVTIALHRVFDMPRDRLIFDVSHQAYTHKILTGRRLAFTDPDHYGRVSGFTSPKESPFDDFELGHTGTSISLACGMAKIRDLTGGTGNIIALIGDGALSSGPAFEGMDWAGEQGGNLIIVVNDNEMSIAENHGGLYKTLADLRASGGQSSHNPFRDLGLGYQYVEEGNSVGTLIRVFESVKDTNHPIVIHIHTRKGLGLGSGLSEEPGSQPGQPALPPTPAEGRVEANHWQDGIQASGKKPNSRKVYGRMAMELLESRFATEPGLVVISPATPLSNGIDPDFRQRAGKHYLDVGIAESHAVAYASGMARAGGTPIVATSSTFFQRAYDQIEEEMSINHSPVTLLVFSTGISGTDVTHSGLSDIAMMKSIPGLTCLAPTSGEQFLKFLSWSTGPAKRPVAIRVPGERILAWERQAGLPDSFYKRMSLGRISVKPDWVRNPDLWSYHIIERGSTVALLALGDMLPLAAEVTHRLENEAGIVPTLIDPQQYSHIDTDTLSTLPKNHRLIVTLEDGQVSGGWGQDIASYYAGNYGIQVQTLGAAKEFKDRVPLNQLAHHYHLTREDLVEDILKWLGSC